jgi:uncharacterized membrane protein
MVTARIEINRPPEVVFDYIAQLDRHGEWQPAIVSARKEPPGPTRLGTRNIETRRVPGGPREFVSEITQYDPPRILSFQGVDGPVRPRGTVNVDPIGDGSRSRVTLKLDFVGRGFGRLFAIFAEWQARNSVPHDQARLKEILEKGV